MSMVRAFLYVVSASKSADEVTCPVPWRVDDSEVFFGPCKKHLREELSKWLGDGGVGTPPGKFYLVGFNRANPQGIRKVLWAGRVIRVMTFARAHLELRGARYQKMREHDSSPLHVTPLVQKGRLIGYEHTSSLHEKNGDWKKDLGPWPNPYVDLDGKQLLIRPGASPQEAFPRDACALCENLFFAQGEGIPIDEEAVSILRRVDPMKSIDSYAIFGRQWNGAGEGLRGRYPELSGGDAKEFIAWIRRRALRVSSALPLRRLTTRAPVRC